MSDDFLKELQVLKETLASLSTRVQQLEQRARGQAPTLIPPPRSAGAPQVATPARPTPATPPRPVGARPPAGLPQLVPAGSAENLETKVGRYWLNRIGIALVVLGTAFLILLSLQSLGALAKIAIGYALSLGLILSGSWLTRRATLAWYAKGLLGGGWAITYFTTYAMYHVPQVRLLESALVDLVLLLAVTAGAVTHALRFRSQVITVLAFLLGFITTSISTITYFTLASSVLLVVALVGVTVRMRWHALLLYGIAASYLGHALWVSHEIAAGTIVVAGGSVAVAQFWLAAGFLLLYWVAYTTGILALDERDRPRRNALITGTLANGLLCLTQLLGAMPAEYRASKYLVLLGAGGVYLLLSSVAQQRGLPVVSTVHRLLGLTLATLAIPERLTHDWTSFLWLFEVWALAWLGVRYERPVYRLFAGGLGGVMLVRWVVMDLWEHGSISFWSWMIPWRVVIGLTAIAAYGATAACYRLLRPVGAQRAIERQGFHLYAAAASLVAWTLTASEATRESLAFFWALEAATLVLVGWRLQDRALRIFGFAWMGTVAFSVLIERAVDVLASQTVPQTSGVIATLYLLAALYRSDPPGARFGIERVLRHGYGIAGSVLLTILLWSEVPQHWLSLAWALEGFTLVTAGFLLQDKVFRLSGLCVFALLVGKVLLVDMAGAETIYRVLSFLVAGGILLLASLAYAKFTGKAGRTT